MVQALGSVLVSEQVLVQVLVLASEQVLVLVQA
jgi:hypothetical protein